MGIAGDIFLLAMAGAGTIVALYFFFMVLRHGRGSDEYPPMSNRTSVALLVVAAILLLLDSTVVVLLVTLTDAGITSSMFAFSGHMWVGVTLGVVALIGLGMVMAGIVLDPHTFRRKG